MPLELRLDTVIVIGKFLILFTYISIIIKILSFIKGSLAKGSENHVRALIGSDTVNELLMLATKPKTDRKLIEATLSALKSIVQYPFAPVDLLRSNVNTLTRIISKI